MLFAWTVGAQCESRSEASNSLGKACLAVEGQSQCGFSCACACEVCEEGTSAGAIACPVSMVDSRVLGGVGRGSGSSQVHSLMHLWR
jgi:hypothetical protein